MAVLFLQRGQRLVQDHVAVGAGLRPEQHGPHHRLVGLSDEWQEAHQDQQQQRQQQ